MPDRRWRWWPIPEGRRRRHWRHCRWGWASDCRRGRSRDHGRQRYPRQRWQSLCTRPGCRQSWRSWRRHRPTRWTDALPSWHRWPAYKISHWYNHGIVSLQKYKINFRWLLNCQSFQRSKLGVERHSETFGWCWKITIVLEHHCIQSRTSILLVY